MKKRYPTALSAILYLICAVSCICLMSSAVTVSKLTHTDIIIIAFIVFMSGYFGTFFRCIQSNSKKKKVFIMKNTLAFMFVFYLILLIDFTLIDDSFGRNIFNIFSWDENAFVNYLNNNTNLAPFETIKLFINGYINGKLTLPAVLENILGNIAAFMPFSIFVPLLFKRINKWYKMLAVVLLATMLIELLQFAFLTGSSDIDDVMLNTFGAMAVYAIMFSKKVKRYLPCVTFGVWNDNEKI